MAEKIYTLKENGELGGLVDRQEVHAKGILHAGVQCWLMNENDQVLLQRRAATKDKSAGKWDVSFGGHCTESHLHQDILLANLIKEGKEEIGFTIEPEKVIKLGEVRYTSQKGMNREILSVYLIMVDALQGFSFEDGEVTEVKWIDVKTLRDCIIRDKENYANRLGAVSLLEIYLNHR